MEPNSPQSQGRKIFVTQLISPESTKEEISSSRHIFILSVQFDFFKTILHPSQAGE